MRRLFGLVLAWLAGCSPSPVPDGAMRMQTARALAAGRNWAPLTLPGEVFDLLAFVPVEPAPAASLFVYIEGDGLAWRSRTRISADPTPLAPMALRLALAHPDGAAASLARPCQYIARGCTSSDWTDARYSARIVTAMNEGVDQLKSRSGASEITLVGYSGGAVIAALLAQTRDDVAGLVTIAGNLDHAAWTSLHRITPLDHSLNPADHIEALAPLRQWHLAGARDTNVPPALTRAFIGKFPKGQKPQMIVFPEFTHTCCWAEQWPAILANIGYPAGPGAGSEERVMMTGATTPAARGHAPR